MESSAAIRIMPGQLWRWDFSAMPGGGWMWQRVTEAGRSQLDDAFFIVYRDDLFVVMAVDDEGPYQVPDFNFNESVGLVAPTTHRWHVVLLRDTLCWVRHDWFQSAVLERDVL